MKTILCYGDSNVWGFMPGGGRYPWEGRWTGILATMLKGQYRVIEEGLNGRNTGVDDPLFFARNGTQYLPIILETHYPADILIVMLGSNDMKKRFNRSAENIAQSMKTLVKSVQAFDEHVPEIIVIAPPHIIESTNQKMNESFTGALEKSKQLSTEYRELCLQTDCHFIDASAYCKSSLTDGVHLPAEGHTELAKVIYKKLNALALAQRA